ncbi:exodeoxyribonuclease V subunit alpha [Methylomonas paludis]|uniref:RecBCD enzyme subunit RecD n=1 Tax=Methylomonas paludis TaxID=1173101 RepID=A0A975MM38_9GAMM|nr:exodeoxyribonuclease V subunit alpha [Methylomonas paludis]QWF70327.1 exodeoxyribonuclease V subunit alpha [Methylomonas paludis]
MNTSYQQQYSRLDYSFAEFLVERCHLQGEAKTQFRGLILELSAQQSAGHSCMQISAEAVALIQASGLAEPDQPAPLVVEAGRLYLHRYWQYETRLAGQLAALSRQGFPAVDCQPALDHYFPGQDAEPDWQKLAAQRALTQGLTIISGGPGTGKTTTVVKILALLQQFNQPSLHIALAAPTGKAAMRLQESIDNSKQHLPEQIRALIPSQVSTLHRLLGAKPPTPYFRHHADNPLPYDLLVVDESSMVDLALMSKLVDALKPGSRLILLGDKDQLASVESGAVLADLTQSLPGNTIELLKSHRFHAGIKQLADAVNQQHAATAWDLLTQPGSESGVALLAEEAVDYAVGQYRRYLALMASGAEFKAVFTEFSRFQVLCANQQGPNSVADINFRVEQQLSRLHNIHRQGAWYAGRPVMITANTPSLQLFNGDIGICLPDAESGQLKVFFPRGDGSSKKISPARLQTCQTVFAMTVHKSQGSEFEQVLIMLPEQLNPVLSKELLYTAITRAKQQVKIVADREVFIDCVNKSVQRLSGLAEKLALAQ